MNDVFNGNELTIEEVQKASLEILEEVASICEANGFCYTLTYGTLIGAIRHGGFIPWDDDIDILMPRDDFFKLKDYMNNKYSGKLKWCDRASLKNYPYCIPRITNMDYKYVILNEKQKSFEMGTFIDVYPLDNYFDSRENAIKFGKKIWLKNKLFDCYIDPNKARNLGIKICKNIISTILHFIHGNKWMFNIDDEIYELIKNNTKNEDKLVGVISQYEWREILKREWFNEFIDIEFEDRKFKVCSGYNELLTSIYGDYMKLPEKSKRVPTHGYKMYIR